MSPDCSFDLIFHRRAKQQVIDALRNFCVNDKNYRFDPDLISKRCNVMFVLEEEPALVNFASRNLFSRVLENKILIGMIALWIKEGKRLTADDEAQETVEFTFWPVASGINQACLDSQNLRTHFFKLLEENNGIAGYIDHGDGSMEEFWLSGK